MRICEKSEKRLRTGMDIIISDETIMVLLQHEMLLQLQHQQYMMRQLWLILDITEIVFIKQALVIIGKIEKNMMNYCDEKMIHNQIIGD